MSNRLGTFAGILLACALGGDIAHAREISNFTVIDRDCRELASGASVHAYRSLVVDRSPRYLVVEAATFATRLVAPASVDCDDASASAAIAASAYGRARNSATAAPFPLSNDGVTRAARRVNGVFLTADLCPASAEKFEHRLFDELERVAVRNGRPVPIALAVSGKWLRRHDADFETLLRLVETRKIAVTWVNHSNTHPYRPGGRTNENFLLEAGVHPDVEIEMPEIELLRRGQLPSPFFRFPGLISNRKWIEAIAAHSLIPLGADAWLAKGERPKSGSVILVHATGNEPEGVTRLLRTLPEIEAIGPFLPLSALF